MNRLEAIELKIIKDLDKLRKCSILATYFLNGVFKERGSVRNA